MSRIISIFCLILFINFCVSNNSYSQTFSYTGGSFEKNGNNWVEKAQEGRVFYFQEYKKDENYYYIKDNSRSTELQIPISGGWSNIKTGVTTTIQEVRRDPITRKEIYIEPAGGDPIWSKLYFVTLNSKITSGINSNTQNQKMNAGRNVISTGSTSNQTNQNFKTCINCGKKIVFGENYFFTGAGFGMDISAQLRYGTNEHDTKQYLDNWDNKFARICCSKICSDADGKKIILKRQQQDRINRAKDAKTPVASSRNCDYCEKRILYRQRFFTKSSAGSVTTYEYQSNDHLNYNQAWRGEGAWLDGKVIYCSKKCAYDAPNR